MSRAKVKFRAATTGERATGTATTTTDNAESPIGAGASATTVNQAKSVQHEQCSCYYSSSVAYVQNTVYQNQFVATVE